MKKFSTSFTRSILGKFLSQFSDTFGPSVVMRRTMTSIETTLLFVAKPELDFTNLESGLNKQLRNFGCKVTQSDPADNADITLKSSDFSVSISKVSRAVPAEKFTTALDSLMSDPHRGVLSDVLFRHDHHLIISLIPNVGEGVRLGSLDRLKFLKIAHSIVTHIAQHLNPAALYWAQSNQLLLGQQYANIMQDPEPWALFARGVAAGRDCVVIEANNASMDRAVIVMTKGQGIDAGFAAGLTFIRHAMTTGKPIASGHSFGTPGGCPVTVTHVEGTDDCDAGYHLAFAQTIAATMKPAAHKIGIGNSQKGPLARLQAAIKLRAKQKGGASGNGAVWLG